MKTSRLHNMRTWLEVWEANPAPYPDEEAINNSKGNMPLLPNEIPIGRNEYAALLDVAEAANRLLEDREDRYSVQLNKLVALHNALKRLEEV